ncbi:MBL fold metallo-hydrolase [Granulicella sp. dw_53]|uniref:MBL fold metallo-hydrolase n=1 Tax=Granulicella sp. dw_53 TaxID=2719792 RepID=UPI001BD47512|nr:MBL fold metallo-hydrolase [Granulicella sp. dw_53]
MGIIKRAEKVGRLYVNPVPTQLAGFKMTWKILPLYWSNQEERFPKQALGPFRTDTAVYDKAPESGLRVTWMGHSATLLEIDGVRVLIDPVWDERASPMRWAGPRRFFAAPLKLEEMPKIDVVIVSHDHYDHLGRDTIERLARMPSMAETQWVTSLGVGKILQRFGVAAGQIRELDWTESVSVGTLSLTALPTRHFSGRGLTHRSETLWSSFVLKGPRHTVYFGADSGFWEGFAEIGRVYGPFDLTMLEIGAYHPLWENIHMGPDGAGRAFDALGGAGLLMPIHWGLFDLALHGWRQPIERMIEVAEERGIRLWSPEPGVPTEVVEDVEHRSSWWH